MNGISHSKIILDVDAWPLHPFLSLHKSFSPRDKYGTLTAWSPYKPEPKLPITLFLCSARKLVLAKNLDDVKQVQYASVKHMILDGWRVT